jgi:2-dehydro-3-deoxyphosphogluconate aldolase/(4S)-4-hydroxy-2-oxoglutarate aldolase
MPTGGVSPTRENLEGWFKAGVTCVGIGSKLIAKNTDGNYHLAEIESKTRIAIEIIKNLGK